eukprot:TRINITY_DN10004_c0_g1_i1.p1 TRINITY_DN10004_c0_g1~~TRINITY_DN10004_c0_g1_i1.p1  ORF type:complete len:655 (+),score=240.98 TRINITY_DN10004_c0_g1_i1:124-2088(+)
MQAGAQAVADNKAAAPAAGAGEASNPSNHPSTQPPSPVPSGGSEGTGAAAANAAAKPAAAEEKYDETRPREPLLDAPPTEDEVRENAEFLRQVAFTVENAKQGEKRDGVLGRLDKLIRTWMSKLLRNRGNETPDNHGGRLLTFGSYKLGVHFPGADIDTLCIAPRDIDREDFFDTLVNILRRHSSVTELNPVRDAHVPVIKMKFDDVPIDLVFCALDLERIPPSPPFNIGADSLLRNLDDPSQRSINGSRVAEKLLRCVPNVDTFRWALRGIKLWAKNRGVYGNVYGFPGGVAWAILTANVCQLYPQSPPSSLIKQFFRYYATNTKPEGGNAPVYLTQSLDAPSDSIVGRKGWDRKNAEYEVFPVITPMPPFMNSCYNVKGSSLKVMCREFERGHHILRKDGEAGWGELWAPSDFFLRYKVFLQVEVSAKDAVGFNAWSSFVESKLRHLVALVETWPQYSDVHEIAKTSYQLEVRLWPFLFRSDAPDDRLRHTVDSPGDAAEPPVAHPAPTTPTTPAAEDKEADDARDQITGYFFIGVDASEKGVSDGLARQIVDFGGAVDQFYQQLWVGKTDKMKENITLIKRRQLPEWVLAASELDALRQKAVRAAAKRKRQEGAEDTKRRKASLASSSAQPSPAKPVPSTPPPQTGDVQMA